MNQNLEMTSLINSSSSSVWRAINISVSNRNYALVFFISVRRYEISQRMMEL